MTLTLQGKAIPQHLNVLLPQLKEMFVIWHNLPQRYTSVSCQQGRMISPMLPLTLEHRAQTGPHEKQQASTWHSKYLFLWLFFKGIMFLTPFSCSQLWVFINIPDIFSHQGFPRTSALASVFLKRTLGVFTKIIPYCFSFYFKVTYSK